MFGADILLETRLCHLGTVGRGPAYTPPTCWQRAADTELVARNGAWVALRPLQKLVGESEEMQ